MVTARTHNSKKSGALPSLGACALIMSGDHAHHRGVEGPRRNGDVWGASSIPRDSAPDRHNSDVAWRLTWCSMTVPYRRMVRSVAPYATNGGPSWNQPTSLQ